MRPEEKIDIVGVTDSVPLGVQDNLPYMLTVIYPFSAISALAGG